jgi:hypothetical protein
MSRTLLLATPLLLIAAAPPGDRADAGKGCMNHGVDHATAQPSPDGFRRLDQLPPANEMLTVIHAIDGCRKPVIVRYNIGGNRSLAK